ncbi:MAG: protein-disulfide reductase DsbD family protein [Cellvibrionaceae bacterium]|nr:protein-disulfide reductase DsbD family protein [Cellvibrionaceae bacterium]
MEEAYRVSLTVESEAVQLDWLIAPDYYLYRDRFKVTANTGDGNRTLPAEIEPGLMKFDEYEGKEVAVFYTTTRITVPIGDLPNEFILSVRSQGCADAGLCYAPNTRSFEINRQFGTAVEAAPGAAGTGTGGTTSGTGATGSATGATSFGLSLLFALLGGVILNLMPCVFPVLSLKALSFASSSGSAHRHHLHGWAYTLGVVGSFVIAAVVILIAKAAGEQSGWGFQLQSPTFVALMAYLFLVMGLSLSGMVYFGTRLMGVGQGLTTHSGLRGSFFTGVLAALVASPCTGPFMATALGYALTQPAAVSLSVFVALGFGMALPFLLLSYSPKLANMLPRPGVWMEKFKELLAFPMYAAAAWLLYVFGRQVGMGGVFFLLIGAVALVLAIWLFQNLPQQRHWRWFVQASGATAAATALAVAWIGADLRSNDAWKTYSKELVEELRSNGQPVLVDFTADWCVTCKTNEAVALSREGFRAAVSQYNVALVKGDWTNEDPTISAALAEFNRSGVPLYLMYPADPAKPAEVLPQLLTQDMVINAIKRAAGDTGLAGTP